MATSTCTWAVNNANAELTVERASGVDAATVRNYIKTLRLQMGQHVPMVEVPGVGDGAWLSQIATKDADLAVVKGTDAVVLVLHGVPRARTAAIALAKTVLAKLG